LPKVQSLPTQSTGSSPSFQELKGILSGITLAPLASMKNTITLILCFTSLTSFAARKVASVSQEIRVDHARELMGSSYHKSIVAKVEKKKNLEANILDTVTSRLPDAYKHSAHNVANAIIKEATLHGLDPYFVMAVISGESSFNPLAIGPVGEIGLMQIRPTTGEWIAKMTKTPWRGAKALKDPVFNIKLGTAYIAWLRNKFSGQSQLYLAAYNMGAKSVLKAVGKNIWPKDYPRHVMKRYVAFYRDINTRL
jgi:soluble lytic murein transglycosylase-like protein